MKRQLDRTAEINRSIMKGFRSRIWSKFTKAIAEYHLIEENDHIAVCISGGKDSMILALCMQQLEKYGDVPFKLRNKKVFSVSMSSLVSGTKYRGEFEEKINKLISEVESNEDIILFIDEIHTLVGAGGADGAIDASNVMVVCPVCNKATRVAYKVEGDKKARICKKCGAVLDASKEAKEVKKATKATTKKKTKKETADKAEAK